jgi:hypothetical protein
MFDVPKSTWPRSTRPSPVADVRRQELQVDASFRRVSMPITDSGAQVAFASANKSYVGLDAQGHPRRPRRCFERAVTNAERVIWDGVEVRAVGTIPWLDVGTREDDSAERLVRRFFDACETPRRRARTDRLLRRLARSALGGGTRRWKVMNALVSNRFSTKVGIDDRAKRMQLISAHLLGLAYARYVFEIEPLATLPVEEIIAISVPVVQHYMADCPPSDRLTADPCVFATGDRLPRRCALCAPAYS